MKHSEKTKNDSALLAGYLLGMAHRFAAGDAPMPDDPRMLKRAAQLLAADAGLTLTDDSMRDPTTGVMK